MSCIEFKGEQLPLTEGESVLEVLLRHGHDIPNGCRSGVCQACVMSLDKGEIPAQARRGLSDAQQALNHFLSCQCHPSDAIGVSAVYDSRSLNATVIEKTQLNGDVLRLRLVAALDYKAGQYVTLWRDQSLARCYSLASHPLEDDFLEFHIRQLPGGRFSRWATEQLAVGDQLQLQGPLGHCIYTADSQQPLLLAAIGTGLAPVYGVLRDALIKGHTGPITLLVGARKKGDFYLVNTLNALAEQHGNLDVHLISQDEPDSAGQGDIYLCAKQLIPNLSGYRVFIAGSDSFVNKMRKQCFLSGAAMPNISVDLFLSGNS